MKKTTKFANKRRMTRGEYNGAEWVNVISRCRPYSTEKIPGATINETTHIVADNAMLTVRLAFASLRAGTTPRQDQDDFDRLAHAFGVACIRAGEIGGAAAENNPLLPLLIEGNKALKKILARRQKFGKWEVLAVEASEVAGAVEIYETILQASSPVQMTRAAKKHAQWALGQVPEEIS